MNNQLARLREAVAARLDAVKDPLTGKGLFTSGRISGLSATEDGKVSFTIEAPAAEARRFGATRDEAEAAARAVSGVASVTAVLTAHEAEHAPAASPSGIGGIGGVKAVIAVASAKGGVGKSTVAVNLACAFAALGHKTGLLDLDLYGPSAPTMFGVRDARPETGPNKTILPIDAFGLKTMSIGYVVDTTTPMIWRGAMATGAARQLIDDVIWGDLDILVLDMPPGTGDIQLTLLQRVRLAGAVIVSTPQELALADVRRGVAMFEKTHAPILGVIENMAYFEDAAGARTFIFGEGGARRTAEEIGAPFLGEIPINVRLRESADSGAPLVAVEPAHPISRRFLEIATDTLANVQRMDKPAPKISLI